MHTAATTTTDRATTNYSSTASSKVSPLELHNQLDHTGAPRWLDAPQIAWLVRTALKEAFPGAKFSVTSDRYSMGSSVRVSWTNGPSTRLVAALVRRFEGKGFDGQTDSEFSRKLTLDGQPCRFGSWISCSRTLCPVWQARADRIAAVTGTTQHGKLSDRMAARPSRTADRVAEVVTTQVVRPESPVRLQPFSVEVRDRYGYSYVSTVRAYSAIEARAAGNAESTAAGFVPADPAATVVMAGALQVLPKRSYSAPYRGFVLHAGGRA